MAASMTYDSLVTDVSTWADRDDSPFLENIPRLIMLCENRIASEIRGLGYLRFVNGTMTTGDGVIIKPARWRETASLTITSAGQRVFLKSRGYQYVREFWPDSSLTDQPRFYSDYDYERFLVVPTPDADYAFELAYYERPQPLDDTTQTNWTTQYAPQLLLYGSLLEAQPFLKNEEKIAVFQSMFDRAKSGVEQEAMRRGIGDQSLMRSTG